MPKGTATAKAYKVELVNNSPVYTYMGLVLSSTITATKDLDEAVALLGSGEIIFVHTHDQVDFRRKWRAANGLE